MSDFAALSPDLVRGVIEVAEQRGNEDLASATLGAVADPAGCSRHSMYLTFGGRDGLLAAVYEEYSLHLLVRPATPGDLPTVEECCEVFADAFVRAVRAVQPAHLRPRCPGHHRCVRPLVRGADAAAHVWRRT